MQTLKKALLAGSLLLAVAVVGPAAAGPHFVEGQCSGDAGGSPSGACSVGGGIGNVASISGGMSVGFGPGRADMEDMYLIFISDPKGFSAGLGPATGFDTQLWLFRAEPGDPANVLGLLANDDASAADAGAMLGSMSDDGTGIALSTPGLYYLAISGGDGVPGGVGGGRIPFAVAGPEAVGPLLIFVFMMKPTEISGPDGPGGMLMLPIFDWLGEGEVGSYEIALEGVSFIESTCPWDCEPVADGSVGINDFLTLLSQWAMAGVSCDFDGVGVGINDFLELLSMWGPCP